MRNQRWVLVLFLSVVLCSAVLAAVGLRAIAADTARIDARYRDQANAALSAVRGALESVVEDARRGGEPAIALRIASDGTLAEPVREHAIDATKPGTSGPRDRVFHQFLSDEVDRLEREGKDAEARSRLRGTAAREEDRWLAAWSLSTLAAIEKRAGEIDLALADWRALADGWVGVRDERGLDRSLAARYEIVHHSGLSDDPARTATDRARAEIELFSDLITECAHTDEPATWALKSRVAEELRSELETEERGSEIKTDAPDPDRAVLLARLRELDDRDRRTALEVGVLEAFASELQPRLANLRPGDSIVFDLRRSPLDAPDAARRPAVAVLRHEADGTWRGGVLELERAAELALARPEIAAYAALGIATTASTIDGRRIAIAGAAERDLHGEPLVEENAAPPFERWNLAAFGLDRAGFLAHERQRFLLMGALSAIALIVAGLAGFATLRAVRREVEATKSREAFVGAVTHELKAPLASIRLLAEVLGRGGVEDEKVREFAARTVSESDRLTRLVDSILQWAKIEHGGAVARETIDLTRVAARALETFRPLAIDRGFDVALRVVDENVQVLGDADALEGALLNLLDNALKYSDTPHTIEIEVARGSGIEVAKGSGNESATHGLHASLAVLDRGRGVPRDEAARIFEPFRRVGDELVRDRPGVGLGLALVHKIALAHGGRATCTPRDGGGTRFAIEIPLAEVAR